MGCSSLIWIIVLVFDYSASLPVGPDIEARARLIKVWPPPKKFVIFWIPSVLQDLPSGMFAGAKIPSKSRARTLIEMSFSLRTIDLDFSSGTFSTSGWMTLEWDDPRWWDIWKRRNNFTVGCLVSLVVWDIASTISVKNKKTIYLYCSDIAGSLLSTTTLSLCHYHSRRCIVNSAVVTVGKSNH